MFRSSNISRRHVKPQRRAVTVLELIIALPILVIGLMAVVELGLLAQNQSLVQRASRAGADAARTTDLPTVGAVPAQVLDAIRATLECEGVRAKCVRVEHNQGPAPPYVLTDGSGDELPPGPVPNFPYVRVSVCVANTDLAPNLLRTFCLDLEGECSQRTTTRCY